MGQLDFPNLGGTGETLSDIFLAAWIKEEASTTGICLNGV